MFIMECHNSYKHRQSTVTSFRSCKNYNSLPHTSVISLCTHVTTHWCSIQLIVLIIDTVRDWQSIGRWSQCLCIWWALWWYEERGEEEGGEQAEHNREYREKGNYIYFTLLTSIADSIFITLHWRWALFDVSFHGKVLSMFCIVRALVWCETFKYKLS